MIYKTCNSFKNNQNMTDLLNIPQRTVSDIIDKFSENGKFTEIAKLNSKLQIYNT